MLLTQQQGNILLELARSSILLALEGKGINKDKLFDTAPGDKSSIKSTCANLSTKQHQALVKLKTRIEKDSLLCSKRGVFVTLKEHGLLRGCIGFPYPVYPLHKAIVLAAKAAAFEDPRFRPIDKSELSSIKIEISVLTVPEEIHLLGSETRKDLPNHINIGEDGLIVQQGSNSGLLLPQVFTEHKATRISTLEMTCQKAGLPHNAWKHDDCSVLKFQAQVFNE